MTENQQTRFTFPVIFWALVMVTMIALSIFAQSLRQSEINSLAELKEKAKGLAAEATAHEQRKQQWFSSAGFDSEEAVIAQEALIKTIRPFDGSLRSELPERLWKGDLPLVFLNCIEDSTLQLFLGDIEAKLQVIVEKVKEDKSGLVTKQDAVSETTYDLTKNAWSFFELRRPDTRQKYFEYRFLNSLNNSVEFDKVEHGFDNYFISDGIVRRDVHHIEDFKNGRIPKLLLETKVKKVKKDTDGGTEYYRVKHILVLP